eukprot:m.263116 g.263116  ORF g.263116 m.263116 type:complete len:143 (-) comp11051_c0_seq1:80-508(-)
MSQILCSRVCYCCERGGGRYWAHDKDSNTFKHIQTHSNAFKRSQLLSPRCLQYDFATDVASYLHRVGRTARAGAHGRVLNCLQPGQRALADEIQRCLEGKPAASHKDDQERGMSNLFSRKRRFRRKFARAKTPPQTSSSQAG